MTERRLLRMEADTPDVERVLTIPPARPFAPPDLFHAGSIASGHRCVTTRSVRSLFRFAGFAATATVEVVSTSTATTERVIVRLLVAVSFLGLPIASFWPRIVRHS